jgi:hypothetical protein
MSRRRSLLLAVACLFALLPPSSGHPQPAPGADDEGNPGLIFGTAQVTQDVLALLAETRNTYGPDALALQVRLLHAVVHAESIRSAGVRVTGVEPHGTHRYLQYFVETGIVFETRRTDRRERVRHLWEGIVLPVVGALETCDVPADGIALELEYTHRSYRNREELEETVEVEPGLRERVILRLLRPDILALRHGTIDGARLFSRSGARVEHPAAGR